MSYPCWLQSSFGLFNYRCFFGCAFRVLARLRISKEILSSSKKLCGICCCKLAESRAANSQHPTRCPWGSTTATTATSSSRTPPPPGGATSRASSTSAPVPSGTTPSATKVSRQPSSSPSSPSRPGRRFLCSMVGTFRRTPYLPPRSGPFRSFRLTPLFLSSAEQHGGVSSLLLPDGTLAKGICHHFVRTVSHLTLRRGHSEF